MMKDREVSFTSQMKMMIRDSPYANIEQDIGNTVKKETQSEVSKIRGFMAEKLRRKSILNCEMFKYVEMDYKKKVNNMLEAIDEAAGTTYKKDRQMILQAKIDVES